MALKTNSNSKKSPKAKPTQATTTANVEKLASAPVFITQTQEKFLWEKAEPISSANQAIWRRDVAGAIIKVSEFGIKSEFGWTFVLIDPNGPNNEVNNLCCMHWRNAAVQRKDGVQWVATVTGSTSAKETFNYLKETRIPGDALRKLRKTVLFQPTQVGAKKVSTVIRKTPHK